MMAKVEMNRILFLSEFLKDDNIPGSDAKVQWTDTAFYKDVMQGHQASRFTRYFAVQH